jgi:hypothetical protein
MKSSKLKLPDVPYRGLLFFESMHQGVFAGRADDSVSCAEKLMNASVLILHGRTGCGKSSFLRAGLAPFLERMHYPARFMRGPNGDFKVVRSGPSPLRALANLLWYFVQDAQQRPDDLGGLISDPTPALLGAKNLEGFVELVSQDARKLREVMEELALSLRDPPVIVIDQAEEVLTLQTSGEQTGTMKAEVEAYFSFLRGVAERPSGAKIIISLRTEYKGQFDDRLAGTLGVIHGGTKSFYLSELNDEGLLAAILRPTVAMDHPDGQSFADYECAPYDKYGFNFGDGVPQLIIEKLRGSSPRGGILPVLQVTCRELYETTKRQATRKSVSKAQAKEKKPAANGKAALKWVIRREDVNRFGVFEDAVAGYLKRQLDTMLRALSRHELPADVSDEITKWLQTLYALVRVEPDGRTVTQKLPHNRLVEEASGRGALHVNSVSDATGLEYLARSDIGILRSEDEMTGRMWTLGHDALGLALQKWSFSFDRGGVAPMKMGMNAVRDAARYVQYHLFNDADAAKLSERKIRLPQDFLWDHQLPHFAQKKGFAKRLGLDFVEDDQLKPRSLGGPAEIRTMEQLKAAILEQQAKEPGSVLVAYERSGNGFPKRAVAHQWSDVLISDLFLGNSLVGPPGLPVRPLQDFDNNQYARRVENMQRELRQTLMHMVETKASIICYDHSAKAMIELAAKLAGQSDSKFERTVLNAIEFKYLENNRELGNSDPLFLALEEARSRNDGRQPWMIGTAFGRALAVQSGFTCYFTSQHIAFLLDEDVKRRPDRRTQVTNLFQKMLLHTLWQIGIPPAMWNQGVDRAVVLRLASVGYYTAAYILSEPIEFVNHLESWQSQLSSDATLKDRVIKETVMDCFNFYRFDEYAVNFFDQDSKFAYWVGHDAQSDTAGVETRSVAGEIYMELVKLRLAALDNFASFNRSVTWLRAKGAYDLQTPVIADAHDLKERAWRHFHIMNFYDAERYMRRASDTLDHYAESIDRSGVRKASKGTRSKAVVA